MTAAEQSGYKLFLTADKNLRYQQNLAGRKISIVVLGQSPWPLVRQHIGAIVAAVNTAKPGSFVEVEIPLPAKKPFVRSCTIAAGAVPQRGVCCNGPGAVRPLAAIFLGAPLSEQLGG